MAHIIIIGAALTSLENKMSNPPTAAQSNLKAALENADEYAHDHEEDTETIQAIEAKATSIKGYLDAVQSPTDARLQSEADGLNALVP